MARALCNHAASVKRAPKHEKRALILETKIATNDFGFFCEKKICTLLPPPSYPGCVSEGENEKHSKVGLWTDALAFAREAKLGRFGTF